MSGVLMIKNKETKNEADGEHILYHFMQKKLLATEEGISGLSPFQKKMVEEFVIGLGIWPHVKLYKQIPVLLPFVVRDASCRNKNTELDKWGCANSKGYLRDDNSLIKGYFASCTIKSKIIKEYEGKKIGKGFVASPIWRDMNNSNQLASTFEMTNSFVPNLVWLPKQISKLTDREGSYAQLILQTISYKIYRNALVNAYTDNIWSFLKKPDIDFAVNLDELNFFNVENHWIEQKRRVLLEDIDSIFEVLDNQPAPKKKVICSAYLRSLVTNISPENVASFTNWLKLNRDQLIQNIP